MQEINSFSGDNAFLSNFYLQDMEFEGRSYKTSEHAFQAAKTEIESEKEKVRLAKTPASAKSLGKRVTLRKNWNYVRTSVMKEVLLVKFANPELKEKLLATGTAKLVEANSWNDTFWGTTLGGRGENRLGKILMQIRDELTPKA